MQITQAKLQLMEGLLGDSEWLALQSDRRVSFFSTLASEMSLTQEGWSKFWRVINLLRQ